MTRALNATGRPIVYSCSWPAYQGGLPPKVRVVLPVVGSPVPRGSSDSAHAPLTALPLVGQGCKVLGGGMASCQASLDVWGSRHGSVMGVWGKKAVGHGFSTLLSPRGVNPESLLC